MKIHSFWKFTFFWKSTFFENSLFLKINIFQTLWFLYLILKVHLQFCLLKHWHSQRLHIFHWKHLWSRLCHWVFHGFFAGSSHENKLWKRDRILWFVYKEKIFVSYLGISVSRFHPENLVMPGVDTNPLYLDWLGLAKGKPIPAELPRRAAAAWDGVLRFRIMLQASCDAK